MEKPVLPDSISPLVIRLVAQAPEERPRARTVERIDFLINILVTILEDQTIQSAADFKG